jgi:hypothetical protein
MTAKELAETIFKLSEEQQKCPIMYMDEVWLKLVKSISIETENEFGVQDEEIGVHIRLNPRNK